MASEMVLAYGDSGLESTPADDVVEIAVLPVGPGNALTPAARRFLNRSRGGVPTKLLQVKMPNARAGRAWVSVRYACTPLLQYEAEDGPVYLHESGCQVCSLADVDDPLFAGLTQRERERIAKAVRKAA